MPKSRTSYKKYNLQTKCRICLTQSTQTGTHLAAALKSNDDTTVAAALEYLTGQKVPIVSIYPTTVCGMCLGLLNIAYDLKHQFQNNQKVIKDALGEVEPAIEQNEPQAPVELVIGDQKYDIKNLMIVEDKKDTDSDNFEGFLNNLGSSITATFVRKPEVKMKPRVPHQDVSNDDKDDVEDFKKQSDLIAELDKFCADSESDRNLMKSAIEMLYNCMYCKKRFPSLNKMKDHLAVCSKMSDLKCVFCRRKFVQRKYLTYHIRKAHLSVQEGQMGKRKPGIGYVCDICGKECMSNSNLKYHKLKHSGKRHKCDVCKKMFFTNNQLLNHKQTHSKNKTRVLCPICGKSCHYQSGLFYHMKLHGERLEYQCQYCDRRFYYSQSLKRHERTHTGDRPYACDFCPKNFPSMGERKKHELLHTGKRPFKCKYCNKGFTQSFNLKMHMMTHSGDYQCGVCQKSMVSPEIVKLHMKQKHNDQTEREIETKTDLVSDAAGEHEEYVIEIIEDEDDVGSYQELDGYKFMTDSFEETEDFCNDTGSVENFMNDEDNDLISSLE